MKKYKKLMSLQAELRDLFGQLNELLKREGENNWIRGVSAVLDIVGVSYGTETELHDALIRAKSIYNTMNAGYGSFSDYGIWRENYEERVEANKILDKIKSDIWQIIEELE